MAQDLQEGIYYRSGERPGKFFTILFLRASKDVSAFQIRNSLLGLWTLYQGLKRGQLRDLPGHPVDPADLSVLLAYGPKAFAISGVRLALPADLQSSSWFRSPLPAGGGPLLIGAGLRYAPDISDNVATEEFAVQFIANSPLAAHRCVVETWKYLQDTCDPRTGTAPVMTSGFFHGVPARRRAWSAPQTGTT